MVERHDHTVGKVLPGPQVDAGRRDFLRKVLQGTIGGTLLFVVPVGAGRWLAGLGPKATPDGVGKARSSRYAFVVDITRCIGCGSCVRADRQEYMIPDGCYRTWVERYLTDSEGQMHIEAPLGGLDGYRLAGAPAAEDLFFVPKLCNMCASPSCVQVCPVGASYRSREGFVLVDGKRCVGCGYCVQTCPYAARYLHPQTHTADKCTWCFHRVKKGLKPACVEACPVSARMFADLEDPDDEAARLVRESHLLAVLKPDMGNQPTLRYLGLREEVV